MTVLAPAYLFGALLVAAGIVLLHFIVTKQPRSTVFPTARFVPELPAKATSRAARPSDLLLMLLRVLTVIAAGAGLARPIVQPSRAAVGRVVLADLSRSVGNAQEVVDSVRLARSDHSIILAFDSTARRINSTADTASALQVSSGRGSLSAALIAGLRAASDLRDRVDSVDLVIVSPFVAEETDAATNEIRAMWPGRARLVRVTPRSAPSNGEPQITVVGDAADPLLVTVAGVSAKTGTIPVRVLRNATADSVTVAVDVSWPAAQRPRFAIPRAQVDSPGAVITRNAVVASTFERKWSYPADSIRGAGVIARWVDGEPAAIEKSESPSTCIRSVAIPVAASGDLVIRPEFASLVRDLTDQCGEPVSAVPLDARGLAALRGGPALAPARAFQVKSDVPSPIAPWLLGLALVGALAELLIRNRGKGSVGAGIESSESREAKAA